MSPVLTMTSAQAVVESCHGDEPLLLCRLGSPRRFYLPGLFVFAAAAAAAAATAGTLVLQQTPVGARVYILHGITATSNVGTSSQCTHLSEHIELIAGQ